MIGTGFCTKAAADTLSGIDLGNSLLSVNADRVSGANLKAVSVSKAGECTVAVTGVAHICSHAGLDTVVNILSLRGKAGAVAGNVSNLFNNVAGRKTHYLTDLCGNAITTGNTKAGVVGLSFGKGLSIAVTAGESAGTAVGTGKTVTDSNSARVLFNSKEDRRKSEKHRANDCDHKKDRYSNNYRHFSTSLSYIPSIFSITPAKPKNASETIDAAIRVTGSP